jgi:hypothetical protein
MLVTRAVPVVLTNSERTQLKKMAYGHKTPYQARQHLAVTLVVPGTGPRGGCCATLKITTSAAFTMPTKIPPNRTAGSVKCRPS